MKILITALLLGSTGLLLFAQEQEIPSPIILIYDASGSMWGQIDGKTKMAIASEVLEKTVEGLSEAQPIGLVAYGHRNKEDCQDVETLVPFDNREKKQVTQAIHNIQPLGKTPLAFTAKKVIDEVRQKKIKATIILLTDGIESCDGELCSVIKDARSEGIEFRLHIVGFGLKPEEATTLHCAADAGGGQYFDASDAQSLTEVLQYATATPVDKPAGNVGILAVKNGKRIDALVKAYQDGSHTAMATARSYGDTAQIFLPAGAYKLTVTPLEGSDVSAMELRDFEIYPDSLFFEEVNFDGGIARIKTSNNGEGWDAVVKIIDYATGKVISGGRTYGKVVDYEVNPGIYQVTLQALVIEGMESEVQIDSIIVLGGESTEVNHNFETGTVFIGAKNNSGLVDATITITDTNSGKNVAGGRTYTSESNNPKKFILTPGSYQVTLRALRDFKGKSEVFPIEVKTGTDLTKNSSF